MMAAIRRIGTAFFAISMSAGLKFRRCAKASHSLSPRSEAKRGEGGVRGRPHALLLQQRLQNDRQHAVAIAQHVVVPEAHHPVALARQERVACGILGTVRVLPAVNLDHKALVAADEINNEGADRLLADEFEAAQPPIAHCEPQLAFSIGWPAAQLTLDAHFPAIGTAHASLLDQLRRPYHNDQCARLPLTPPSPRFASLAGRGSERPSRTGFNSVLLRFWQLCARPSAKAGAAALRASHRHCRERRLPALQPNGMRSSLAPVTSR